MKKRSGGNEKKVECCRNSFDEFFRVRMSIFWWRKAGSKLKDEESVFLCIDHEQAAVAEVAAAVFREHHVKVPKMAGMMGSLVQCGPLPALSAADAGLFSWLLCVCVCLFVTFTATWLECDMQTWKGKNRHYHESCRCVQMCVGRRTLVRRIKKGSLFHRHQHHPTKQQRQFRRHGKAVYQRMRRESRRIIVMMAIQATVSWQKKKK